MSHVATVDLEIKSLDDLEEACQRLGLQLVRGQDRYKWYGTSVGDYPLPAGFEQHELGFCEHAIRLPPGHPDRTDETYEIGVCTRRDGKPGYTLLWDFFARGYGLENVVGKECHRLRQAYAAAAGIRSARQQGFRVSETVKADGSIQLVCQR